jgi:hypothetical protein
MQEYGRSAGAYKQYAETYAKREDAGEMYFRSALVYEKMKAWPDMIDTLQSFIKKYNTTPKQKERIIEAYEKIGEAEMARGKEKAAQVAYKQCVAEFAKRHISVSDKSSANAASCALQIAESRFREYDDMQITGSGKNLVKALQQKATAQRDVEKQFTEVFKYKRVEETLAASYRIGYSYERFAEALFSAPVPPEFKGKQELEDEYKAQLEEKAEVLERKAETAYRKAYDEAKRTRVSNEWTQRILEGLNKYAKEEFPIQKRGKSLMQTNTITGNALDDLTPRIAKKEDPGATNTVQGPGGARTAEKPQSEQAPEKKQ